MLALRPKYSHAHIKKSVPTAPPALKTPLAVAMVGVVIESYPASPSAGRSKYVYQPGCPMVLLMMDEQ